ncbi:MAG: hypothetical protein ACK456_14720 [Pseudanabaenaceae cyanobacterium]
MTYAATKRVEIFDKMSEPATNKPRIDPMVVRAAKQVYYYYVECYGAQLPRPLGVAVNRYSLEGKLIYSQILLLPQETFVSIDFIED